jgi:hypothetical protein
MTVNQETDQDDGTVRRAFGVIVDISDQKRSEREQETRLEEAVELKHQQENFIDMISHEVLPLLQFNKI